MQKHRLVFFGSSNYVIPIIEVLQENFDLVLVVTTENNPADPIPSYCIKNKIPYLSVSNLSGQNLKSLILNLKSPLAVLASFGVLIPNEVLNLFPHGIINIHPSLLPKYRGPTPVQTAILNGEKETGVTIIKLDSEIDHGPILAHDKEPIFKNDASDSLYERLFRLGSSSIVSTIELYLKGEIKPKEQNHKNANYTKHLTRQDGFIDLQNPPKLETLNRMIRAYFPWPSVWTRIGIMNHESGIKGKILKFLPYEKIQVEGKKPVSYKDFINGYPKMGKEIISKLGLLDNLK